MNNYLYKFKKQPYYFRAVFLITILPMLLIVGAFLYAVIPDAVDVFTGVPETGYSLVFGLPFLLALVVGYIGILYLCSKKSLTGFIASVLLFAVIAAILFYYIAQWTSGAKL